MFKTFCVVLTITDRLSKNQSVMDEYHAQIISRGIVYSRKDEIHKNGGLRKFHKPESWNMNKSLSANRSDLAFVMSDFPKESKSSIIQDFIPYIKHINEYEDGKILKILISVQTFKAFINRCMYIWYVRSR